VEVTVVLPLQRKSDFRHVMSVQQNEFMVLGGSA